MIFWKISQVQLSVLVNASNIFIHAKRQVIIVADNYIGDINHSIAIPAGIVQTRVMLLKTNV